LDGTLVAVAEGEMVGELRVDPSWMGFGDIGMMVAADWRGRGVGSALVAAAIEGARARGLHKLALGVFPHNESAIRCTGSSVSWRRGGSSGTFAAPTANSGT